MATTHNDVAFSPQLKTQPNELHIGGWAFCLKSDWTNESRLRRFVLFVQHRLDATYDHSYTLGSPIKRVGAQILVGPLVRGKSLPVKVKFIIKNRDYK